MRGVSVVYFGGADWSFRREPQHYILEEVVKRGGSAYYVENTGVRWPRITEAHRISARLARALRSAPSGASVTERGVRVISPIAIPIHPSRLVRRINARLVTAQIRRAAHGLRGTTVISWISLPNWTTVDVTERLDPELVLYYVGEEFAAVPGAHPTVRESERHALKLADIVFATSRRLQTLCERAGRRAILAPVAVDVAAFTRAAERRLPKPRDLEGLPGRTIGYVGGLNHKVDTGLLRAVVEAYPQHSVVVLGSVEDAGSAIGPFPNLRMIGERPYSELPAYLQHFDVCLVPYVRTEFTDSVSPAKLIDYLAAGRPVVATAMAEILPFRGVVRIAEGPDEFVLQVRQALEEKPTEQLVAARVEAARSRSIDAIVPPMLDAIERRLVSRSAVLP